MIDYMLIRFKHKEITDTSLVSREASHTVLFARA